jgi:acetyltransferase-like isoleucine patch superfamily enzyme
LKKIFKFLLSDSLKFIISFWPGPLGFKIRASYYRRYLKFLGKNVKIDTGVFFQNPEFISIEDNCWIDKNVVLLAGLDNSHREKIKRKNEKYPGNPGEIFVGKGVHLGIGGIFSGISSGIYISDYCGFSANCKVYSFTSHYRSENNPSDRTFCFGPMVEHSRQCIVEGPVYLEENVGVALNAVILPGVTIEKNTFISINTVVNSSVESNSILRGNPGKVVSSRFKNK